MHEKHDTNGNPIGRSTLKPILDTCIYEAEFLRSEISELAANITAKWVYIHSDDDGNKTLLLESLTDHRKDDSGVSVENETVIVNGREALRKSTTGWDVCCK